MSFDVADGATPVTLAEHEALLARCTGVLSANAQVRGRARRARSEAVELRLRSQDERTRGLRAPLRPIPAALEGARV
jgi:hypothetical protein